LEGAPVCNDIDLHLGKRLRRRRRLMKLTQEQLAAAVGVSFQQIQKYECGANRISAAQLWRLSQALEVPIGYFYEDLANLPRQESLDDRTDSGEMASRRETKTRGRVIHQIDERPLRRPPNPNRSRKGKTEAA
jgi:transcriptional regulator with XRE-family HTH domain